ncbi:uncharacterized protein LOC132061995 [Lycium ferocissimum]|uniref:uncharacterized protein LOC132061995 n=1 Tax=Lycium ferocissimum TaxID=112874 RepID=UPI002816834C|nr:uncharacterized protein LOC132061995 [Lycium ferocissimum]
MGKLIDQHQMAFLKGRQIMDAALLANELVDSRFKKGRPGILCKLDIEKAFDHVNWGYLLKILEDMGFGHKWINWIKFCISSVRFSIMINGCPAEGLNHMVRTAKSNGWIRGFDSQSTISNHLEITHLLYADDSLVFCDAEMERNQDISQQSDHF